MKDTKHLCLIMISPDYRTVLAGNSEYLPESQAERDAYFTIRAQLLTTDTIHSPGAKYLHVANLLPQPQRSAYGPLEKRIADRFGMLERRTLYNPNAFSTGLISTR